jgi:hypothetical protein
VDTTVTGSSSNATQIDGWAVLPSGTLTPLTGSPYNANGSSDLGITQNYLFGSNAGTANITSWNIQSDGSLATGTTSSTPWAGTASEGPFDLSFDTSGTDLYSNYSENGTYQGYTIGSNGSLSFINFVDADESASWLSFTANDAFAYQSACYHGEPAIFGYARSANGSLSVAYNPEQPPQPTGLAQGTYCPWGAATIGSTNLIIAEQPTDDITPTGSWQMVDFAIASDGSLSTSDTSQSAPTVTVGEDVNDYEFDSTQTWLAVGGTTGVQLFQWADGKLTAGATFSVPNGVYLVRWDNAGHLFALSATYGEPTNLYVFTVSNGVLTPAAGSPVAITGQGYGLAVKPLS